MTLSKEVPAQAEGDDLDTFLAQVEPRPGSVASVRPPMSVGEFKIAFKAF